MGDESKDQVTVVLDIGDDLTRAGLAGEDAPRLACSTAVAVMKKDHSRLFYGDEALNKRAICKFVGMFNADGVVSKAGWKHMQGYLTYVFGEMRIEPSSVRVLVCDSSPGMANRVQYTNMLLDMGAASVLVKEAAACAAFSHALENALVVDVGVTSTRVSPVLSGNVYGTPGVTHVGGELVSHKLSFLACSAAERKSRAMRSVVDDIKRKCCVVEAAGAATCGDKDYELPDGEWKTIKAAARRGATELLFNPGAAAHKTPRNKSLATLITETVAPLGDGWAPHMYMNVVLTGATTLLPGYKDRLLAELKKVVPSGVMQGHAVAVVQSPQAKYSVWMGGSIYATLSSTQALYSSKRL